MALANWDPFRDLVALQERMNRLFEESLSFSRPAKLEPAASSWSPLVDIYETETDIVLKVDIPGVQQEDIEVEVRDNTLFLRGERKLPIETQEENYHRIERPYGPFQRSFTLPFFVHRDKFTAVYREGVLEVVMPKVENVHPQQIRVNVR